MDTDRDRPLVLIVEDDSDLRRILQLQIQKLGYRTDEAENGRVGFGKARDIEPDLLLLDLMMPEMDGFQVLKRVKCIGKLANTPVLILTASHEDHHRKKGLSHMADGFMTKPYTIEQLRHHLERLLPQAASR
jgi:DNA-binding response OmpR family regulator